MVYNIQICVEVQFSAREREKKSDTLELRNNFAICVEIHLGKIQH